jgi:hypothetical protein
MPADLEEQALGQKLKLSRPGATVRLLFLIPAPIAIGTKLSYQTEQRASIIAALKKSTKSQSTLIGAFFTGDSGKRTLGLQFDAKGNKQSQNGVLVNAGLSFTR